MPLLFALPAMAAPPPMSHSGLLRDASGALVEGPQSVDVTLYDADDEPVWTDSFADVPFHDGVFHLLLGEDPVLPAEVLGGGPLFLELTVGGVVFPDRHQLQAVPYAGWAYGVQLPMLTACDDAREGALRWTGSRVEVCDGSVFQPLSGAP